MSSGNILFTFTESDLDDQSRLIVRDMGLADFSIADNAGRLVLPSRMWDNVINASVVDFSGWAVTGIWSVLTFLPVDGSELVDENELRESLLANGGIWRSRSVVSTHKAGESIIPLPFGFHASGFPQLKDGLPVTVIVPATGEGRQTIGVSRLPDKDNGVVYQFQLSGGGTMLYDVLQDSLERHPSGHGEVFTVPELLPAFGKSGQRITYGWRTRASWKYLDNEYNTAWSSWSREFSFVVNVPPSAPTDLIVHS